MTDNNFSCSLLTADFAAAAVLISFGALLGKTSPLQLLIMAFIEIMIFSLNEWIGLTIFKVNNNNNNNNEPFSLPCAHQSSSIIII